MTRLSVNIDKIAVLRNARGGDFPNVVRLARDIQDFGAGGITVHPRPDERHIRYQDVRDLRAAVHTELNVEGNPTQRFMDLVLTVKPDQVTLVPDAPDVITSNAGWDVVTHLSFLQRVTSELKQQRIRTSIFLDPCPEYVAYAVQTGGDCIELYTEGYARGFAKGRADAAVKPYVETAQLAHKQGLDVHAGHDLNSDNLSFFKEKIDFLAEVSIGHALISEALYSGLARTVQRYLRKLSPS